MTCGDFRDRAFDYLEGAPVDRGAFEAHRAACPSCSALLAGIEENERLLSSARVPAAPPDLWPRIARALSAGRVPAPRWPLWAAALVLVGFATILLAGALGGPPPLDVVIEEAGPALGALAPRYDDVDAVAALVDTLGFPHDF